MLQLNYIRTYYDSEYLENTIIIDIHKTYTELYVSSEVDKFIVKLEEGYDEHIDVLSYNIRNSLDIRIDISLIDKILILSDLKLESFRETLKIDCEYLKVEDSIVLKSLLESKDSREKINFIRSYRGKSIRKLNFNFINILIFILVFLSICNFTRYLKSDSLYKKKDIDILSSELMENRKLLEKLGESSGKSLELNRPVSSEELSYLLDKIPRETYIEHISIEAGTITIDGYSNKRESILLYLQKLNEVGENFILSFLNQYEGKNGFSFSIESKELDEVGESYDE